MFYKFKRNINNVKRSNYDNIYRTLKNVVTTNSSNIQTSISLNGRPNGATMKALTFVVY